MAEEFLEWEAGVVWISNHITPYLGHHTEGADKLREVDSRIAN
jgi:hypothetical protein